MTLYDHVLGAFLGAAAGDAMGAITETLPLEYILEFHGAFVREFIEPPKYVIAAGQPLGSVTDDYSLAEHLAFAIIRNGGAVNSKVADEAVMGWYDDGKYLSMMGPSIYDCVMRMKGEALPPKRVSVDNSTATNGGGMKVFPAGLLANGDVDKAIHYASIVTANSHNNSSSMAGACAVAAAVAAAMRNDADMYSIVQAGLLGARRGHDIGAQGCLLAVPRMDSCIELAVELALRASNDIERAMYDIRDLVGCGLTAYQSIASAFGAFVAAKGNVMDCLYATVNMGDDSDTVATMACAIAGAFQGYKAFPADFIEIINKGSEIDLQKVSHDFCAVIPNNNRT